MNDISGVEQLKELLEAGSFLSLFSSFPSTLISVAVYVFTAISLYTLADRRDIGKPWLAWIPVVRVWILGAIADDYWLKARGERKSRRKVLLGTNIALTVLSASMLAFCVIMFAILFAGVLAGIFFGTSVDLELPKEMTEMVGAAGIKVLLVALPLMVVAIIHAVFYYIALYDLYRSCEPNNATLYLVLSIFVTLSQPVFLFLCRKKDDGMPKPQLEIPPAFWEPPAPPAEPWQTN